MEARRRQAKRKAQRLLLGRLAREPKILLEAHFARHEHEISGPHADGTGNDRRNAARLEPGEELQAELEDEEVERVDVDIDVSEEFVEIGLVDAVRKDLEVEFGVD